MRNCEIRRLWSLSNSTAKIETLPVVDELEKTAKELEAYKVREHKAIVDRTNLQYLLYTTRELTEITKLSDMILLALERLYNTYRPWGFGFLIENTDRPSVIEYMSFLGIEAHEKKVIMQNHLKITNDISASSSGSTDFFFGDDDDDSDEMFTIGPSSDDETRSNAEDVEALVYGGDKEEVSKLLCPDGGIEWMVMPGNIGEDHTLKVFIRGEQIDSETLSTIRLFLSLVSAMIHNYLLKEKLAKLANTDALTGLVNRGGLDSSLQKYIHMAENEDFVFAVIAIDVNGLKYVNDTFGHQAGDTLINEVGNVLRASCRKTDVISRSGGDEFIILCPHTNNDQAQVIIDRIRSIEEDTSITCVHKDSSDEEKINVRLSLGVADSSECSPEEVVNTADHRESLNKQEYYKTHKKYR